ncbi:hypothetical protein ABEY62_12065 [Priestia megaterium]|nr:hypothetical protein [Priestia megaterium]
MIGGLDEVLHGNQLRCHKRFSSCIPFVRLSIKFISLCLNLSYFFKNVMR